MLSLEVRRRTILPDHRRTAQPVSTQRGDLSPGAYASSCEDDDDDFQDPVTAETISDPVLCRSGAVIVMRTLLI